jgi:hypothetical protein
VTFRISLDSSFFISQLTGDVHAEAVLAALTALETMGAVSHPIGCAARRKFWSASRPSTDVFMQRRALFPKRLRDHALAWHPGSR